MPGFDGTGPRGSGPMTGRARGTAPYACRTSRARGRGMPTGGRFFSGVPRFFGRAGQSKPRTGRGRAAVAVVGDLVISESRWWN